MTENSGESQNVPTIIKFVIAGLGGMGATAIVQPIDVIKNRMQMSGEGGVKRDHAHSLQAVRNIVRNEGFLALYGGISANLFRQATYTTSRMGFYQTTTEWLKKQGYEGIGIDVAAGLFSGFLAALITTPTDVALVRMTTDGRLPESERRNYAHVFNALYRIGKEEGIKGLWAGTVPTIWRAMVANVTQLVSYTQFKRFVIDNGYFEDNAAGHFVSSLFSGFIYATTTCPFDTGKTRIQTMKSEKGTPLYTGLLDVWLKTAKKGRIDRPVERIHALFYEGDARHYIVVYFL